MPEPSPSDARLLEPSSIAYELAVTDAEELATEARQAHFEDELDGVVKRRLGAAFWIALAWMTLVILLALFAPLLTDHAILKPPNDINPSRINQLPTATFRLGTDNLGRDQLSRLVWGARVSLPVGFSAIALGLLVGSTVGLVAGYLKGWSDNVLMTAMDIVLAFPALLLGLAIVGFTDGRDIAHISLAIGIVTIPQIARLVRANTLSYREREFVLAARTLGAGHQRVIVREILPNVVPPVISFGVIGVAVAIAAEAALSFLGVSVAPPTATWGGMIQEAAGQVNGLQDHPFQVFLPCLILVITIMSMYLIGDRLGQLMNVRERAL